MTQWTSTIDFTGVRATLVTASARAVHRGGELILEESLRVAPSEDGELARSGTVTSETTAAAAVSAVAYDTGYAVRQHEQMDLEHDPGRSAKYLEVPLVAAAADVAEIAADGLRKALR